MKKNKIRKFAHLKRTEYAKMENFEDIGQRASRFKIFHLRGATCVAFFFRSEKKQPQTKSKRGGKKMSFSSMLEILKNKNKGKIVIVKLGAFYIATDEEADFLYRRLKKLETSICRPKCPK